MNHSEGSRRRWIWAAAGAGAALVGFALLFRTPSPPREAVKRAGSRVTPVKLVNLKRNEAALTDPTPLFLPTEWNAGQDALPDASRLERGSTFAGYPAKLKFAESELALQFPADIVVPARAADALDAGKVGETFLGRGPEAGAGQLAARKAFVEVTMAMNGETVLAKALPDAAPPGGGGWQPTEFLVAVDAMGMVGPPILTESSRVPAVDSYFQNYLAKTLRVGERLAPGFYRICIGP